jgi:drug/metabolite transporter (DMT)-like permease
VSAVCWAAYGLATKPVVGASHAPACPPGPGCPDEARAIRPLPAFAITMLVANAALFAAALVLGDVGHVARVGAPDLILLFGSGVVCVGVAQALYFLSIRWAGVAASQVVALTIPFLTGVYSLLVLGERIGALQWASGALIVAGVAWLVAGRHRLGRGPAAAVPGPPQSAA